MRSLIHDQRRVLATGALLLCSLFAATFAIGQELEPIQVAAGSDVPEVESEFVIFEPPQEGAPLQKSAGSAAESVSITNGGTDWSITLNYNITQQCFFGGTLKVTVWEMNGSKVGRQMYTKSWTVGYLGGVKGWVRFNVGPGVSKKYRLQRHGTKCDSKKAWDRSTSTKALKAPTSVVANSRSSDALVALTWKKASNIPSGSLYYSVYKNGVLHRNVGALNTTVSSLPATTDEWRVATRYGSKASGKVLAGGSPGTAAYKVPTNFYASNDTTVGYVRLAWTNPSDFSTHVRLYRDGTLLQTLAKTATGHLDATVESGRNYTYEARAYNATYNMESAGTTDDGASFLIAASDGDGADRVRLDWTPFADADFASEVKISRDGRELKVISASNSTYEDMDASPGVLHQYKITAINENRDPVLVATDHGFRQPNGEVRGSVKTPGLNAGGVQDVAIRAFPTTDTLSSAMEFDGSTRFVKTPFSPDLAFTGNATVESWIKLNALPSEPATILESRSATGTRLTANLGVDPAGVLSFTTTGMAGSATATTAVTVGTWHHVAAVKSADSAEVRLYIDGVLAGSGALTGTDIEESMALFIGHGTNGNAYIGLVDEVKVWNVALSDSVIAADRYRYPATTAAALKMYLGFHRGTGLFAGDFAAGGGHHASLTGEAMWQEDQPGLHFSAITDNKGEGRYEIGTIFYGEKTEFGITPFKEGHGFEAPDTVFRTLENAPPDGWIAEANFIDTTSFSISGRIKFKSEPTCQVAGVDLLIDGKFAGVTDANGDFSVSVPQAGRYNLTPRLGDHVFDPPELALDVQANIEDQLFLDETVRTISGTVLGGCANFIGVATLSIASLDSAGCLTRTIQTDENGAFSITLPAASYAVDVTDIANPIRDDILAYLKADTVDVTHADTVQAIVYHAPPTVRITGFPDFACETYEGIPLLRQLRSDTLRFEIFERYVFNGIETTCPVDSGSLHIEDRIGDGVEPFEASFKDGVYEYLLTPGVPNIRADNPAHPYQKQMSLTVTVPDYVVSDTTWAIVMGHLPRPGEPFSTVSPQLPLMILRDPPGDQSYSYFEKETTRSLEVGLHFGVDASATVFSDAKVGGGFDIPFVGSGGAFTKLSKSLEVGASVRTEASLNVTMTSREKLLTSSSDEITGSAGDVFIGGAINIKYGITDVLKYSQCGVNIEQALVWGGDGFKTRYLYTESYIRESLIPELQFLADNAADPDRSARFLDAIEVWNQALELNDSYKRDAPIIQQNVSFSGNLGSEESKTVTQTLAASLEFNLYLELQTAISAGVSVGDFNEAESGVRVRARFDIGGSIAASESRTNTVGFYLGDDDAGDDFTVNIKGDPVFGTPVFDLIGGTSSNPWEGLPSQPRDGLLLFVDPAEQRDVPVNSPAQYTLRLFNTSPSNEWREYLLSIVQTSNPGGARVRTGDQDLDALRFNIAPQGFAEARVDVTRLPGHPYEYEDLQVRLYAENDPQFADTVSFTANFIKPCSDITLVTPDGNWSVTQLSREQLPVRIADFDISDANLQAVKLQYSSDQATWETVAEFPKNEIASDTINYMWDVSRVANGMYSLRAVATCTFGENFSLVHEGLIDRDAWIANMQIADAGGFGSRESLAFGQSGEATPDLDISLGEAELPPSPPAGIFFAGFRLPGTDAPASAADYRSSKETGVIWTLDFQAGAGGYPVQFNWNPAALPAGDFILRDGVTGDLVTVDMRADSMLMLENSAISSLEIEYQSSYACQEMQVAKGWNIVSVPLRSNDMFMQTLFPTAGSKAFFFNAGYEEEQVLRTGVGYWMKFDSSRVIQICGTEPANREIQVREGWNMIGPFDTDVMLENVSTIPENIITSKYFGYDAGYFEAAQLRSGHGYWVRASQNGLLRINESRSLAKSGQKAKTTVREVGEKWGRLIVSDASGNQVTLFASPGGGQPLDFDLPPVPPTEIFDARFEDDRFAASLDGEGALLNITGAHYPVRIQVEGMQLRLTDAITGELFSERSGASGEIVIDDGRLTRFKVREEIIPATFALEQNYPNPFNPSTTIRFSLPEAAPVTLRIYNMLGEQVAELIDETLDAGTQELVFDARRLASGVYFYRLDAGSFRSVKKMVLMK